MIVGLIAVLLIILILPFVVKPVEKNLEIFLFIMGIAATLVSGVLSFELVGEILQNKLLYFITAAVLVAGIVFKLAFTQIKAGLRKVLTVVPVPVFIFFVIVILGLVSSVITAIIAALLLVEIAQVLPLPREKKIKFCIVSCFAIGLGAVLTPIGEPLSTIVISALDADFFYLLRHLGGYVIPTIVVLGLFGAFFVGGKPKKANAAVAEATEETVVESYSVIIIRALKIFLFVTALELLGAGFKPLINTYVVQLDGSVLYWINMLSAVLDNATLAAAEISPAMDLVQVKAILMGLLISGGMLIPGNIPNIISSSKLGISSKEWMKIGLPMGLVLLVIFYVILFIF